MNTMCRFSGRGAQQGYSLVELMVAIVIALFLIAGVLVVEQSVHTAYADRSGVSQLDNDERFTMTLLSEIVQSAGYYPDPINNSTNMAAPAETTNAPNGDALVFNPGQFTYGLHNVDANGNTLDTIAVRFMTASNDGIPLCDGSSNTSGADVVYTNYFYLAPPTNLAGGPPIDNLYCDVQINNTWSPNGPVQLVKNVEAMQISYGLHTQVTSPGDYGVDTYVPAANMTGTDWSEVTSVRITVTFANPLKTSGEAGQNDATFTKVIDLMSRVGGT